MAANLKVKIWWSQVSELSWLDDLCWTRNNCCLPYCSSVLHPQADIRMHLADIKTFFVDPTCSMSMKFEESKLSNNKQVRSLREVSWEKSCSPTNKFPTKLSNYGLFEFRKTTWVKPVRKTLGLHSCVTPNVSEKAVEHLYTTATSKNLGNEKRKADALTTTIKRLTRLKQKLILKNNILAYRLFPIDGWDSG